jgi:capsular exopolysaccharide synthesis family protein
MDKPLDAIRKLREKGAALSEGPPALKPDGTLAASVNPKLFVLTAPDSIDAEIFNVIKSHILFPKDGRTRRTIMVTSAFPGEGKTLVAANLAAALAMGVHESVFLVDCDLRRPMLHEMFGCRNDAGLHEYLTGERKVQDLLIRTNIRKLTLLTAGKPARRPADLLASSKMRDLLAAAKKKSPNVFVVLDGAPCEVTAEASVLANKVDGVVFVIMAKRSPRQVIRKSTETLGKDKILGVVFNGYTKAYKSYHRYYKKYYKKEVDQLKAESS